MTTEEETCNRRCTAACAGNWGSRKVQSCARRGCTKMSVLAYCCCFILSVGTVRSNVQSPVSGIRLLTTAMARGGPGAWAHALRLEGPSPARMEEAEDAADAAWVPKGLRKQSPGDVIVSVPPLAAMSEASEEERGKITGLLSGSPWALVTVRQYPGGRRHSLSFTPRLGRESADEEEEQDGEAYLEDGGLQQLLPNDEDEEQDDSVIVRRRTPPFAPRLGRRSSPPERGRVMPFSPRLGRRRVRSGSQGEQVQSPTAGNPDRNLIFSPRLGRSSSQAIPGSPRSESDGRAQSEESGTKET